MIAPTIRDGHLDLVPVIERAYRETGTPISWAAATWEDAGVSLCLTWAGMDAAPEPITPSGVTSAAWAAKPAWTLRLPSGLDWPDIEDAAVDCAWRLGAWDIVRHWEPDGRRLSWWWRPTHLGPPRRAKDKTLASDGSRLSTPPEAPLPPPDWGRRRQWHLRLGRANHPQRSSHRVGRAPTANQVRYAGAIARWRGEPLPEDAVRSRTDCSAYISAHEAAFRAAGAGRRRG